MSWARTISPLSRARDDKFVVPAPLVAVSLCETKPHKVPDFRYKRTAKTTSIFASAHLTNLTARWAQAPKRTDTAPVKDTDRDAVKIQTLARSLPWPDCVGGGKAKTSVLDAEMDSDFKPPVEENWKWPPQEMSGLWGGNKRSHQPGWMLCGVGFEAAGSRFLFGARCPNGGQCLPDLFPTKSGRPTGRPPPGPSGH